MKKLFPIFLFILSNSFGQTKIYNFELAVKIDSLVSEDQKWRNMDSHFSEGHLTDSSLKKYIKQQGTLTDSTNLRESKIIVSKYGYPGYDLVGVRSSDDFWTLIQHADTDPDFQEKCSKLLKIEVDNKNARAANYAYLIDRIKADKHELQIYGTQMMLNKDSSSYEPMPVIEPKKLNERRNSVGLDTIEEYIKTMNYYNSGKLRRKE